MQITRVSFLAANLCGMDEGSEITFISRNIHWCRPTSTFRLHWLILPLATHSPTVANPLSDPLRCAERQPLYLFIGWLSVFLVVCSHFWHTVPVIWSARLLLNEGLGFGLSREGDSCQIQILGYRSWLLKPTHSFLLQIIAHSLKPCFTVQWLAGKRST